MAVDVDELTLGRVSAAARGTEFAVEALSYEVALERVRTAEIPVILLLEWTAADAAERVRLCESLRRAAGADGFYIVALGGPADHAALRCAAEGPADDALSRPFNADLLLVRLRQSVRAMRQATAMITPAHALDEALAHGSGEVCVRSGDTVARLHVEGEASSGRTSPRRRRGWKTSRAAAACRWMPSSSPRSSRSVARQALTSWMCSSSGA